MATVPGCVRSPLAKEGDEGIPGLQRLLHLGQARLRPVVGRPADDNPGLREVRLGDIDLEIRMTGCPNHCARPPTAEIGIFGYGKNDHVILAGGSRCGTRLASVLYERVSGEQMVPALVGLFRAVKEHCPAGTPPGDWIAATDFKTLRRWIAL